MSNRGRGVTRRPFSGKDRSDRRSRYSLGKQRGADQSAQFPSGYPPNSAGQLPAAPPHQGSQWFRQFITSRAQQLRQPLRGAAGQTVSGTTDDWRNRYSDWKDIGTRYRKVSDSLQTLSDFFFKELAPLPPDEIEHFRKHGIEFGKMLGQGGYGSVWLVTKTKNFDDVTPLPVPQQFACKIMNLYSFQQQGGGIFFKTNPNIRLTDAVQALKAEASIHRKLSHRNIVRCENVITMTDPKTGFPYIRVLIFMELCQGDLRHFIFETPGRKFIESEALNMLKDVSTGLKYLHDRNICHFDIKTNNIMYVKEGDHYCYKLADFGLSEKIDSGTIIPNQPLGTLVYMAPELDDSRRRGKPYDAKATDIYSLGCVLAEAMAGIKNWTNLIDQLHAGHGPEADIIKAYGVPPLCGQLIAWMTRYEANERPTIEEVLNHPWLKSKRQQIDFRTYRSVVR